MPDKPTLNDFFRSEKPVHTPKASPVSKAKVAAVLAEKFEDEDDFAAKIKAILASRKIA